MRKADRDSGNPLDCTVIRLFPELDFFEACTLEILALPLMGCSVSAGFPSPADDYMETRLDLNEHLVKHPSATFYARLGSTSDSMIGAGIYPNDLIIVDRSIPVKHGDVVLAIINNDFTLKRYCVEGGKIILRAENKKYPPITFTEGDEMHVWGVVKHSVRHL